jgi:hypothetical protein
VVLILNELPDLAPVFWVREAHHVLHCQVAEAVCAAFRSALRPAAVRLFTRTAVPLPSRPSSSGTAKVPPGVASLKCLCAVGGIDSTARVIMGTLRGFEAQRHFGRVPRQLIPSRW